MGARHISYASDCEQTLNASEQACVRAIEMKSEVKKQRGAPRRAKKAVAGYFRAPLSSSSPHLFFSFTYATHPTNRRRYPENRQLQLQLCGCFYFILGGRWSAGAPSDVF